LAAAREEIRELAARGLAVIPPWALRAVRRHFLVERGPVIRKRESRIRGRCSFHVHDGAWAPMAALRCVRERKDHSPYHPFEAPVLFSWALDDLPLVGRDLARREKMLREGRPLVQEKRAGMTFAEIARRHGMKSKRVIELVRRTARIDGVYLCEEKVIGKGK
jgi:hypothetical protein